MTTWPLTLPAAPLREGFEELRADATIRTDMDTGPAKIRRRTTAASGAMLVSYLLSRAQAAILDSFYATTLAGGTLPFDFTHPRTGETLSCRFASPPGYTTTNGDYYKTTLTLEVLP